MRTKEETKVLRERAVELRLAGRSLREIKEILGPMSNTTLHAALKGTPPPDWTRRPNAKDDVRAQARELRGRGLAYHEIAARLGVSKSSVSLWVRDLSVPDRLTYEQCRKRAADGGQRYWAIERAARKTRRAGEVSAAADKIGKLSDREILIAGAIAYWCEGAKAKPPRHIDRVVFINSDAALIMFFLRFLSAARVSVDDLVLRVYIHENADAESAQQYWLDLTGTRPDQFRRPVLKRHNPKTARTNVGENYHGCLRIDVLRSAGLYRRIEGWVCAATAPCNVSAG
jgi:transcriptional regulator with XRE-family HTH domain